MPANAEASSSSKAGPGDQPLIEKFKYTATDIRKMSDDAFMDMLESADQETLKAHELMNPAIQQRLESMLSREQQAIKKALMSQGKSPAEFDSDDESDDDGDEGDEIEVSYCSIDIPRVACPGLSLLDKPGRAMPRYALFFGIREFYTIVAIADYPRVASPGLSLLDKPGRANTRYT